MTIAKNSVVSIHYTLKGDDDVVIDSSEGQSPLTYLHGAGNIIKGLEQALEGKQQGDSLQVTVQPEDGYGDYQEQMIQTVPKEAFGEIENLEIGMRFQAQTEQGPVSVVITTIEDDQVTVDGNHPLAGKTLHFDAKVEEIREASEEEIAHGHVHGPGGHDH